MLTTMINQASNTLVDVPAFLKEQKNKSTLVNKQMLSNGMEVYDFDENAIVSKMESLMELIDSEF